MLDVNILKSNQQDFENSLQIQQKLEKAGRFNEDEVENTFDGCEPVDENFDYLKRGFVARIKHWFYMRALKIYGRRINRGLTNLQVVGRENLRGIKGGYIVTCNHISKVDSFAVREAIGYDFKFVAADFNNWKGILGDIARNTGYLPISSKLNLAMMRKFNQALTYFLRQGKPVLIYPEQALWFEYKKPRPLKNGTFHYAVKNNCPVVPLFITIKDKEARFDEQGRTNFGDYTVHILPPIYPCADLDNRANIEYMMDANFTAWRNCYEQTYGVPLTYDTEITDETDPIVKKYVESVAQK